MPRLDAVTCALCGNPSALDDEAMTTVCERCQRERPAGAIEAVRRALQAVREDEQTGIRLGNMGRQIAETMQSMGISVAQATRNFEEFGRQMSEVGEALNEGLTEPSRELEERLRARANLPSVGIARTGAEPGELVSVDLHPGLPDWPPGEPDMVQAPEPWPRPPDMVETTSLGDSDTHRVVTTRRAHYCPECHELLNLHPDTDRYHCAGCGLDVTASELSAGRHRPTRFLPVPCPECLTGMAYHPERDAYECRPCNRMFPTEFLHSRSVAERMRRDRVDPPRRSCPRCNDGGGYMDVEAVYDEEGIDRGVDVYLCRDCQSTWTPEQLTEINDLRRDAEERSAVPPAVTYYANSRILTDLSEQIRQHERTVASLERREQGRIIRSSAPHVEPEPDLRTRRLRTREDR